MTEDGDIVEHNKEFKMIYLEFLISEHEGIVVDIQEDKLPDGKRYLDIGINKYDDSGKKLEQSSCVYIPLTGFIAKEYKHLKRKRKITNELKKYIHALLHYNRRYFIDLCSF